MSGMEAVTKRVAESFERMSLPILIVSLLLTGFLAYFLVGSLAFTTDLSSFAPETDADDAQDRIEGAIGTSPHLVYINVRPAASEDQVANVLEMKALHQLAEDHAMIQAYSEENGFFIISQINAAEILQRFLEQKNISGNLSDFNDWKEMLDAALGDEECGDAIGSDERSIATAAFASSALLHKDLDYTPVCNWLESGEGNPTPTASSTLWLIEISGDTDGDDRQGDDRADAREELAD